MDLNETKNYYNKYANLIDRYFSQGYQYSLVYNEKYSNLSLSDQNNFFLTEYAELNNSMSILDIGCGNGQFYKFIKKHYTCKYYGIDLSENQIKNCKQKYDSNIFECADMHLFKTDQKFDICYLIESIGYSNNIQVLIENIYSLLKPNGQVIIKYPYKNITDDKEHLEFEELFAPIKKEYGFSKDSLGITTSEKDIKEFFLHNGFEMIDFRLPKTDSLIYTSTFLQNDVWKNSHPEYIKYIKIAFNPDVYSYLSKVGGDCGDCGIYKFKKIKSQ